VAAASAFAFQQIGAQFTGAAEGSFGHVLAHAVTGGVISVLQGGKFGHGFFSAGLTKGLNINGIVGIDPGAGMDALRITVAAVVGGTISKVTGGKFGNGAVTAAFAQAFNGNGEAERQRNIAAQKARGCSGQMCRTSNLEKQIQKADKYMRDYYKDGSFNMGEGRALTYPEAVWLWRNGGGAPAIVDGNMLWAEDMPLFGKMVLPLPLDDLKIYGHVGINSANGRIYFDTYDFDYHKPSGLLDVGTHIRNVLTNTAISQHGSGTPFQLQIRYDSEYFN
jgi:hypothetical protein